MKIAICHTKPCNNAIIAFDAFRNGLKLHGDEFIDIQGFDDVKKIDQCDAAVMVSYPDLVELGYKFCDEPHIKRERQFWSIINTFRGECYKKCVESKKRILCIDSGVLNFKRGSSVSNNVYQIGWDSIKGLGQYYNNNSPSDRWNKLDKELKDWEYSGVHIVIFGQVRWGVGSQHIDIKGWYRNTLNALIDNNVLVDHAAVLRLHPNAQEEPFPKKTMNLKFTRDGNTFLQDIQKALCTLSFSSHSIVEAVLNGRPSFCCSKLSMGYPLFYIDNPGKCVELQQTMPDREKVIQWLCDLCYTQWSVEEINMGLAWSHLRPHTLKVEDVGFNSMLCKL